MDEIRTNEGLPSELENVSRLIDQGDLRGARLALKAITSQSGELVELMRIKLAVSERVVDPGIALQTVVNILRDAPRNQSALELYQELSMLQYQAGRSCLSHSHPPPPR